MQEIITLKKYVLFILFLILFPAICDAQFRFALIADLHITHTEPAAEDLRKAVEQINATGNVDFVLVAGDITEEGDRGSLRKAKSILDRLRMKYYSHRQEGK